MVVKHDADALRDIVRNFFRKNIFHAPGRAFADALYQKPIVRVEENDITSIQLCQSAVVPCKTFSLKWDLFRKPNGIHQVCLLQLAYRSFAVGR